METGDWLNGIVSSNLLLAWAATAGATMVGCLPLLFFRSPSRKVKSGLIWGSAGVMGASVLFSLLFPSFETAVSTGLTGTGALIFLGHALLLGTGFLKACDLLIKQGEQHLVHWQDSSRVKSPAMLLLFALCLHNLPEGMAVGAALSQGSSEVGFRVAGGIALQNLPEGLILALALWSAGVKTRLVVLGVALSALAEGMGATAGYYGMGVGPRILPWSLAFAAGAMIFAIGQIILSANSERKPGKEAAFGLAVGLIAYFLVMG